MISCLLSVLEAVPMRDAVRAPCRGRMGLRRGPDLQLLPIYVPEVLSLCHALNSTRPSPTDAFTASPPARDSTTPSPLLPAPAPAEAARTRAFTIKAAAIGSLGVSRRSLGLYEA
jgi:hypothetical protein